VRSAWLCAVAVLVLIAFSVALVPLWGVTGIALATLAAELFWAVSLAALTQKLEGRRGDILGLLTVR
jgi:hypothetical protein